MHSCTLVGHRCQAWKKSTSLPRQNRALLGWGSMNTNHAVVFCVTGAFLTPVDAVNSLFRSVSATKQSPLVLADIHSFAQRHFSNTDAFQHGSSNWRTVYLPAASHHSHSPRMTWQNMIGNIAQYVSPAASHRIWYTFVKISLVWLSLLIIGWTWHPGPEQANPRYEMMRRGQS